MAWRTTPAVLLLLLARCAVAGNKYPPVLTSVLVNDKQPSSLTLSSTRDIRIFCQSEDGTPIGWIVPAASQSFGYSNGSLTIPKREMDYQGADTYNGDYICFTNNILGTAVASTIRMQIAVVKLEAPDQLSVNVNIGSTVILKCRTKGAVRPSSIESAIDYVWYWQSISKQGSFGRADFEQMYTQTQGRIAVDDNNQLYIRNVQRSDFDSSSQLFIACRTKQQTQPGAFVTSEMDVGQYTLNFVGTETPPVSPTLMYSTPNVTVIEGGNFTLACIFNDAGGKLEYAVTWSKSYTVSIGNGARVTVSDAQQQHNGTWECYYKTLKATVNVFVKLNPRLSGITDTFATTGGTATFTCNYQSADTVLWYKNDQAVDAGRVDLTWPSNYTKVMTLRKVAKSDIAVYSCEAKNEIATIRLNGRLIVTDPSVGNVSVNDAGRSVGTLVTVKANTTSIKVGCSFTADPLIENPTIVWRMSKVSEDINENTIRPEYGLLKGSVVTQIQFPTLQSFLTLTVYENSAGNVIGNVTCVLKYKVLNSYFSDASGNSVEIVNEKDAPEPVITVTAQFPYWIIGVIIAALFLILLVFLIIFCVQRNKGEQYYVDEKERKAGHDPKEELPPWQEFNRPDQDPVKGSRASLEMEGDRPMGSDAGSMDEYGVDTDTGKFNEDGSFIGQYGPKGQRPGASGQV